MPWFSREDLERISIAVKHSQSIAGTLRVLGLRIAGANYDTIKKVVRMLKLDTSHWTGQGHRKGCRVPMVPRRPLNLLLVKGVLCNTYDLKLRLISEHVLVRQCSTCGLTRWQGGDIPLELDHRDGDRFNNELSNLQLLCPNCHALTPTYRGRNKGKIPLR